MTTRAQSGYLVLADISGYTSFLAGTELEHAQEILGELLEVIVTSLAPTLTLSKLEGDAVFAYAPEARLARGELLLEIVEATYLAFKNRVENVHRHTTCECAACRAIPTLDLKFLAHYGHYILQSVAGRQEVVGSDVNLAHRLLKNHVAETTGWRAYALFTGACIAQMGVPATAMHAQVETYEHLGEIPTYSRDLAARYRELLAARQVVVAPQDADATLTHDFPAPPAVVWDWLTDPQKRTIWQTPRHATWRAGTRPEGGLGVGARNHCAHGKTRVVEEILDWRPFEYYTSLEVVQSKPPAQLTSTSRLEPIAGGTRLHYTAQTPMPLPRWLVRPVCRMILLRVNKLEALWASLDRCLVDAQAREVAAAEAG
ncbi:MAG TPA: DUF2652 domain-containing protein [Chloroflexia bacterium]|nr:DUF2652 domain-containing protein [Chloroflexia bacterium]